MALFSNIVAFEEKKLAILAFTLLFMDYTIEKRATNPIKMHKIYYCMLKSAFRF